MNRYLGTKTKILTQFLSAISNLDCVSTVCDIFAGSLAVSLFLKRRGYGVIANDINPLSYAYARAYLTSNNVAQFNIGRMLPHLKGEAILKLRRLGHKLIENQRSSFEAENR